MIIIPVIDLLQGHAVLARRGRRADYGPVNSTLCQRGAVLPLVRVLHENFGFKRLYIADLDAILGQGGHVGLLADINNAFPDIELWLDAGFRSPADVEHQHTRLRFRAVIGSETWRDDGSLQDSDTLLSIDIGAEGLRDPSGIATDPTRQPGDLILMNLARVGADLGPDLLLLGHNATQRPDKRHYLAGGIRNHTDLSAAQKAGAAGVLVASALHDGRISAADLTDFN